MKTTKIYITTNGKSDYFVVPNVMATKLTRYYWVAVNGSIICDYHDWGQPPRPLKMPDIPANASEKEVKKLVSNAFGTIVAERENSDKDQGWIGLVPDEWQSLIDRHGIPDF